MMVSMFPSETRPRSVSVSSTVPSVRQRDWRRLDVSAGRRLAGVIDWPVAASLATAGGTLVLALATFASVRSARQAARTTERALLAGIRPVLVPSRFEDPPEKVGFQDDHWVKVPGGMGAAETSDDAIYLAIALRNVGTGLGV